MINLILFFFQTIIVIIHVLKVECEPSSLFLPETHQSTPAAEKLYYLFC